MPSGIQLARGAGTVSTRIEGILNDLIWIGSRRKIPQEVRTCHSGKVGRCAGKRNTRSAEATLRISGSLVDRDGFACVTKVLKGEKEEKLVASDRAAYGCSELIGHEVRVEVCDVVSGIEGAVLEILPHC